MILWRQNGFAWPQIRADTDMPSLYETVATINLPASSSPYGVAVTPDGLKAYVASAGTSQVNVINTATNTIISNINVAGVAPASIAVSPNGTKVYAGGNGIAVINTSTDTVTKTITGPAGIYDLAFNPTGTRLYSAGDSSNVVSVIDTLTDTVLSSITVSSYPRGVLVSNDGTRLYVNRYGTHTVEVYDTSNNLKVGTISSVDSYPQIGLVSNPTGTKLYTGVGLGNLVRIINPSTNTLSGSISTTVAPWDIAINPDGSRIYVVGWGSAVDVIDTSGSGSVIATLTNAGISTPLGLAFNPTGTRLYIANNGNNTVSVIRSALDPPSGFFSMF